MKTILIDDQKKNTTRLKELLTRYCPQVDVIGEALNADEGAFFIRKYKPELVFLDIQMPHKSGFDMLAEIGDYHFEVVFVTVYDQYGIQAVKFSALDYLLKPVNPAELIQAVNKADSKNRKKQTHEQIVNLLSTINTKKHDHLIGLPLMQEIRFVNPGAIIRCETANNYTRFFFPDNEKLLVSKGIYEYDKLLRDYHFIRCHQSHLVNRKYIKSLLNKNNIAELLLTDGSRIPVSRLKKEFVIDQISL